METLAEQIIMINKKTRLNKPLPIGIEVMNPFKNVETLEKSNEFYKKYYSDKKKRILIMGINPGRFGAGITGIPFTDPVKLNTILGIENQFIQKKEPSAGFIYDMIDAFGGAKKFYREFLISAVCPLGFTKSGKNYNYYDDPELLKASESLIKWNVESLLKTGLISTSCFCLGRNKNYKYLKSLNDKNGFFRQIEVLPHPRWIVQYNRKNYQHYINEYCYKLRKASNAYDY
jgi:hypothetical protein